MNAHDAFVALFAFGFFGLIIIGMIMWVADKMKVKRAETLRTERRIK